MKRYVYRYELPLTWRPQILLPQGARVLSVGPPRDGRVTLDLWALIDPQNDTMMGRQARQFRVVGTGHPLPEDAGLFVGSVTSHDGQLVWHVFEAQ